MRDSSFLTATITVMVGRSCKGCGFPFLLYVSIMVVKQKEKTYIKKANCTIRRRAYMPNETRLGFDMMRKWAHKTVITIIEKRV
jgi:hypothetical protein